MDDVPYGSEMEFLAAIACFVFTGVTIYYSVFKWRTYIVVRSRKTKCRSILQSHERGTFRNEIRAKHGVAIGALSQRIVQYKKNREYVQITAEEIQHSSSRCGYNSSPHQ